MDADLLTNLLRTIGFFLDNIVYNLIPTIYQLFIYLSGIDIVNNSDQIGALIQRIYVLLGIFMLFKVSFSLIQYIVDPSAFGDKSKGFGKLITNVLVAMVLLVSVPSIFSFAMNLQQTVLESNVIGKLILGTGSSEPVSTQIDTANTNNITAANAEVMAKDVQFMMFGAFYSLNTDISQFKDACGDDTIFGSSAMAANRSCIETLSTAIQEYDETQARGIILDDFFKTRDLDTGVVSDRRDFYAFDSMLWWEEDGDYVINYLPLVSTFAGIFVVFLLTSFSIEVAVRVIKLAFLQMIAPIAIVSYIDPKETIGNGKLNGWIKESVKTYFSLFLRLATIFLVMLLISVLASTVLADGSELAGQINDNDYNIWIYLFLIIGAFMFAKQVPNMIESIFGIKGSGEFSLNPFKNVGMAGLTGAALGGAATAIGAAQTGYHLSGGGVKGALRGLASGATGAVSGALGGGINAYRTGGKGFVKAGLSQAGNITQRMQDRHGTTWRSRMTADFQNVTGSPMTAEIQDQRVKAYDDITKGTDRLKEKAKKWATEDHTNNPYAIRYFQSQSAVTAAQKALEDAQKEGRSQIEIDRLTAAHQRAQENFSSAETAMREEYIQNHTDTEAQSIMRSLEQNRKENRINKTEISDWSSIDRLDKDAKEGKNIIYTEEYKDAHAAMDSAKRKASRGWRSRQ